MDKKSESRKRKSIRYIFKGLPFALVGALIGSLWGIIDTTPYYIPVGKLAIVSIIIVLIIVVQLINSISQEYDRNEKSEKYYDDLRHKIIFYDKENTKVKIESVHQKDQVNHFTTTTQADNRDIIELMIANMKEINEYYVLSKRMTRQSFVLAVCMCIGGFMIIAISVAFIVINNLDAKEAIIPVISGAVIEAIAATTLIVYKKSLEQLK